MYYKNNRGLEYGIEYTGIRSVHNRSWILSVTVYHPFALLLKYDGDPVVTRISNFTPRDVNFCTATWKVMLWFNCLSTTSVCSERLTQVYQGTSSRSRGYIGLKWGYMGQLVLKSFKCLWTLTYLYYQSHLEAAPSNPASSRCNLYSHVPLQCFSQKILLEGQSGPWGLVLGANFFRKGAKRTIQPWLALLPAEPLD